MAGEISYQQMTSHEFIMGVFGRYKSPLSLLQRFYLGGLSTAGDKRVLGRTFGWDLFDPTRSIAQGRSPIMGAATVSRKAIGHAQATCFRSHEKIPIPVEEYMIGRPVGGRVGTIDLYGQRNFKMQLNFLGDRVSNAREFALSRIFRGGVGITMDGETMALAEYGAGTIDIESQIPATHLTTLDLGTGSGILAATWDEAASDIKGELLALNKAQEREVGLPFRHIWINSTTYNYLLGNTGLQAVAGTSNRVFQSLTTRELGDDERRDNGYDVVFHGIPQFTFHVYDGVIHTGSAEELGYPDSISSANNGLLIPDNKALFTPDPSPEWIGMALGSEPVQERTNGPLKTVYGFHSWVTPERDPPVLEAKVLDNFMPYLKMPRAVGYGTVSSP